MTSTISFCCWMPLILVIFFTSFFPISVDTLLAGELTIHVTEPPSRKSKAISKPDQLPLSRIAYGQKNILTAWLAGPTGRYRHGVLGDYLEASRLVVGTTEGKQLHIDLPITRVFEDLEPRLADLNGDNADEILVVETDTQLGASLSVYSIIESRLVRIAATPFLGKPNRWLNPLGVGDFDGDGHMDIALVTTPHIGGNLRLYKLNGAHLSLFAEYSDVSTHKIGSTELGLGRVISAEPRDRLLVPNQARRVLILLEWTSKGWQELARLTLPGAIVSSLIPLESGRWRVRLDTGNYYEIQLDQAKNGVGP